MFRTGSAERVMNEIHAISAGRPRQCPAFEVRGRPTMQELLEHPMALANVRRSEPLDAADASALRQSVTHANASGRDGAMRGWDTPGFHGPMTCLWPGEKSAFRTRP